MVDSVVVDMGGNPLYLCHRLEIIYLPDGSLSLRVRDVADDQPNRRKLANAMRRLADGIWPAEPPPLNLLVPTNHRVNIGLPSTKPAA